MNPNSRILPVAGVLLIIGVSAAGWNGDQFVRKPPAPFGTKTTDVAGPSTNALDPSRTPTVAIAAPVTGDNWPGNIKTLTRDRFAPLRQINNTNVSLLSVLCSYASRRYAALEPGMSFVSGAMTGSTGHEILSLAPAICRENRRTHENCARAGAPASNRGGAYMDGMRFRGTAGGRVLAYDIRTGRRVWETRISNPKLGESTLAAPIAWKQLILTGNAGGRISGPNRRMYALEAKTGKIVWEFLLVPMTEDDLPSGPHGATSLDVTTWANPSGLPMMGGAIWTSLTPTRATGELDVRGGNPAPRIAIGSLEGANLDAGSVVDVDAKTAVNDGPFQAASRGLARLVRFQHARADPHAGRQAVPIGCTQGWASLWILDCRQFPAVPYADPPRQNR